MDDPIEVLKKFNLPDEERSFIQGSSGGNQFRMHKTRIISEFYFIKTLEQLTERTIEANTKLAESNEKHSKRMFWLTGALVFTAIAQVIIAIF